MTFWKIRNKLTGEYLLPKGKFSKDGKVHNRRNHATAAATCQKGYNKELRTPGLLELVEFEAVEKSREDI
jgi:hypothetical protein